MRPKGKLFALLAVFAAIGIVTATGAFTTVSAERTVNVAVTGDGSALLAMEPNSTSPNGVYSYYDGNEIEVDVSDANANHGSAFDGSGVNDNATTTVDYIFNVTNQGTQEVNITVSYQDNPDGFYLYQGANSGTNLNSTTYTLSQGETMSIGLYVNTTDGGGFTGQSVQVNIEAEAT